MTSLSSADNGICTQHMVLRVSARYAVKHKMAGQPSVHFKDIPVFTWQTASLADNYIIEWNVQLFKRYFASLSYNLVFFDYDLMNTCLKLNQMGKKIQHSSNITQWSTCSLSRLHFTFKRFIQHLGYQSHLLLSLSQFSEAHIRNKIFYIVNCS